LGLDHPSNHKVITIGWAADSVVGPSASTCKKPVSRWRPDNFEAEA